MRIGLILSKRYLKKQSEKNGSARVHKRRDREVFDREIMQILKAYIIAKIAHKWQKDKEGVKYIKHPLTVAKYCKGYKEKCAALLHDVVEDTNITPEDLIQKGIDSEVVEAVSCLTKTKGQDYMEYLKEVKGNRIARTVKLADLKHNSDLSRIKDPKEEDFKRIEKYKKAIEFLNR